MSLVIIAVSVFVLIYAGVATGAAWALYRLDRGYEEEPELTPGELWQRSILAGIVAGVIAAVLIGVSQLLYAVLGDQSDQGVTYGFIVVEWIAWALFCVWLCELDTVTQGLWYAVLWGGLKVGTQLLVFLPFGVNYWLEA